VLLDAQTIEQSQQLVGGVKRDLLWSDRWSFLPPE
jgi:hypothetical protein